MAHLHQVLSQNRPQHKTSLVQNVLITKRPGTRRSYKLSLAHNETLIGWKSGKTTFVPPNGTKWRERGYGLWMFGPALVDFFAVYWLQSARP